MMTDKQETDDKSWAEVKEMFRNGNMNWKTVFVYICDVLGIDPVREHDEVLH